MSAHNFLYPMEANYRRTTRKFTHPPFDPEANNLVASTCPNQTFSFAATCWEDWLQGVSQAHMHMRAFYTLMDTL